MSTHSLRGPYPEEHQPVTHSWVVEISGGGLGKKYIRSLGWGVLEPSIGFLALWGEKVFFFSCFCMVCICMVLPQTQSKRILSLRTESFETMSQNKNFLQWSCFSQMFHPCDGKNDWLTSELIIQWLFSIFWKACLTFGFLTLWMDLEASRIKQLCFLIVSYERLLLFYCCDEAPWMRLRIKGTVWLGTCLEFQRVSLWLLWGQGACW